MTRAMTLPDADYQALQRRLDRNPTGAPDSPTFQQILRLLFTRDEARLAAQMPSFIGLDALASRVGVPLDELEPRIDAMAQKGLVIDLRKGDRRYVALAPVVIGFYEYTFMRSGDDASLRELAELFDEYFGEGRASAAIFRASTQIGRSLVREEALPDEPPVEVLDWERTSAIIGSARSIAVSICPCRHHARLAGHGCDAPLRTCLTFGGAADAMVRVGLAEPIGTEEAMGIVAECKAAGLAQTGDNVQQDPTYICNCCGCCCGMMTSIKRWDIPNGIVSSNWIAEVDHALCRGCGRCVKACPVDAVHLELTHGKGPRRSWAVVDFERCLGCGVCDDACRYGARAMVPRDHRVFTPRTTFERMTAMAIERGKLGDLLFDQAAGGGGRAVARVLQVLEQTPPARALVAIEPLRSTFLRAFVAVAARGGVSAP